MSTWTEADNERRIDLIDKDIAGDLIPSEGRELNELSERFREHRKAFAPLPIEEAREYLKACSQSDRDQCLAKMRELFPEWRYELDAEGEYVAWAPRQFERGWLASAAVRRPPLVTVPEFPVVENPSGEPTPAPPAPPQTYPATPETS